VLASVPVCLYVKLFATMLHLAPPPPLGLGYALLASVAAVAWRPITRHRQTSHP